MYTFTFFVIILSIFYFNFKKIKSTCKIFGSILESIIEIYFYKPNVIIENDTIRINCFFENGQKEELILPVSYTHLTLPTILLV